MYLRLEGNNDNNYSNWSLAYCIIMSGGMMCGVSQVCKAKALIETEWWCSGGVARA